MPELGHPNWYIGPPNGLDTYLHEWQAHVKGIICYFILGEEAWGLKMNQRMLPFTNKELQLMQFFNHFIFSQHGLVS